MTTTATPTARFSHPQARAKTGYRPVGTATLTQPREFRQFGTYSNADYTVTAQPQTVTLLSNGTSVQARFAATVTEVGSFGATLGTAEQYTFGLLADVADALVADPTTNPYLAEFLTLAATEQAVTA